MVLVDDSFPEHYYWLPCRCGVRSALFGGLGPLLESLQPLHWPHDSLVRLGWAVDVKTDWMKMENPVTNRVSKRRDQATEVAVSVGSH